MDAWLMGIGLNVTSVMNLLGEGEYLILCPSLCVSTTGL